MGCMVHCYCHSYRSYSSKKEAILSFANTVSVSYTGALPMRDNDSNFGRIPRQIESLNMVRSSPSLRPTPLWSNHRRDAQAPCAAVCATWHGAGLYSTEQRALKSCCVLQTWVTMSRLPVFQDLFCKKHPKKVWSKKIGRFCRRARKI